MTAVRTLFRRAAILLLLTASLVLGAALPSWASFTDAVATPQMTIATPTLQHRQLAAVAQPVEARQVDDPGLALLLDRLDVAAEGGDPLHHRGVPTTGDHDGNAVVVILNSTGIFGAATRVSSGATDSRSCGSAGNSATSLPNSSCATVGIATGRG